MRRLFRTNRLLKNARLLRFLVLRRSTYHKVRLTAQDFGALHPDVFEQPGPATFQQAANGNQGGMKKRYHLHITGRVQGLFPANTRRQARALGLTGWVRNLPDDRVETVFEGNRKRPRRCSPGAGPERRLARVDHLEIAEESTAGGFTDFDIVY